MKLTDAMSSRFSARAFLDTPVSQQTVHQILDLARQCPSGTNIQPWKVNVVTGEVRKKLIESSLAYMKENPTGPGPEHAIYPSEYLEPYQSRRMECVMGLFGIFEIDPSNAEQAQSVTVRNLNFYNAPVGLVFSMHKSLMPGQLGDLGIFMGNVMLAARQFGLHTCAQGTWQAVVPAIHEALGISDEYLVYNGMALGHIDAEDPLNNLNAGRVEVDDFAEFMGFE